MKPINQGELQKEIFSATVICLETGETKELSTKDSSVCHFFERFIVEGDEIQLRLDWGQLDSNGYPTLDADFYNLQTSEKRRLKKARKKAHHTQAKNGQGRVYSWLFKDHEINFRVEVHWLSRGECVIKSTFAAEATVIKSGQQS